MRRFRRRRKRRNFGQRPTSLLGSPTRRCQMGVAHLDRSTAQKIHRGFLLLQNLLIFTKTVTFFSFYEIEWKLAKKMTSHLERKSQSTDMLASVKHFSLSLSFLSFFLFESWTKKKFSLFSLFFCFLFHSCLSSIAMGTTDRQTVGEEPQLRNSLYIFYSKLSLFFILRNSLHFFVLRNSLSLSICEKNVFNK